jgi:Uncharacterized protein conserved in bacteria (DUF2059)
MTHGKIFTLLVGLLLFTLSTFAQNNSNGMPAFFQSLIGDLKLKVDTTTPPEDSLTKKIRIFRVERSAFNFDTVLKYQIVSQQSNDTTRPKEYYLNLLNECQHGNAHRLIENILINLYRQCFTEKEVDQLVEFYKTSVGKRMIIDILMITGTAGPAIQQIVKETSVKIDQKMKAGGNK